jgi:hypothetical protein
MIIGSNMITEHYLDQLVRLDERAFARACA